MWLMTLHLARYTEHKLAQLECLRSENSPRCPMITHIIDSYQIPSRTSFIAKSWPNDLEDIGQGQRHYMRHPLMQVIIWGKYWKNPLRTVDTTERTQFSRSRSNDLEDIGQGQRSSHATHLLMLVLYQIWKESIQHCSRYRAETIFKVKAKWPWKYRSRSKVITCDTPSDGNDNLCQIWKECKQNCRFFFSRWKPKSKKN